MYVGPEGPKNATLAIVAEKPGRDEVKLGRPLVGATGREVNDLLLKIGINRSSVYLTNAVKNVNNFDTPTRPEIEAEQLGLYKELAALPNLACVVAMGGVALQALSNFHLDKILAYRGSILPSFIGTKMIPTLHPTFYMRGEWRFKPVVRFDLQRALEESYTKTIDLPKRQYYIAETLEDLRAIRHELTTRVEYISFDIELMKGRYIECIAFSKDPGVAYCIPITNGKRKPYWENINDERQAWETIHSILNQERVKYIAKNGLFDCWHLWRHGIPTLMAGGYDVEYLHRLRAPNMPHDLGFIVSVYTREPYYKDESGSWDLQDRSVTDEQFYIYNCKDAACTLDAFYPLTEDMKECGQFKHYEEEVHPQWYPVMDMRIRGLHVDVAKLREVRERLHAEITATQQLISSRVGWLPNTKSPLDMIKLYNQLGINFEKTAKNRPKMDKEIMFTYAAKYPAHRDILLGITGLNAVRTLQSGFTNIGLDEQNHYHPSLTLNKTKTGRLASKGADEGGPQIQNIPSSLRSIVIPDNPETDELTNADLQGAEAMLLAWFTQDPLLVGGFQKKKDIHRIRGCIIFKGWASLELPPDDMLATIHKVCDKCKGIVDSCNHSERYLAKKSGHAMAYREGVRRFCQELRKEGIFIDEAQAKQIKARVVSKFITQWHIDVESGLRHSPWLETPLGRRREFYGILDEEMLREALAWYCQATVGQITNRAMIRMYDKLPKIHPTARLITQTHDSITTTHRLQDRSAIEELYHDAFHQKMTIHGRELVIPIDIKHGPNWGELG